MSSQRRPFTDFVGVAKLGLTGLERMLLPIGGATLLACSGSRGGRRDRVALVDLAAHPLQCSFAEIRQRWIAILIAFQHAKSHQVKEHGTGHLDRPPSSGPTRMLV